MAAGEYVSVSSQADTERADLDRERRELAAEPAFELDELAAIYESRGLDAPLARKGAEQLRAHDVLSAHARDELGISETVTARPVRQPSHQIEVCDQTAADDSHNRSLVHTQCNSGGTTLKENHCARAASGRFRS